MNKVINFKKVTVYGNELLYITSEQSLAIEKLTGKKTITPSIMTALKELGFEFVQVLN